MVPKGLKSSKKDKPNDWVEDGIQGSTLVLPLITEAAELAPIPYLKEAARSTLKILTTSVRGNKANFQRLADDVARFVSGILKSYQEIPDDEKVDWPPQELRNGTGELVITLESILGFVEEQVGRKKAVRVLYSMADAGKIQEYRERLAAGMNKFEELDKMRSHLIEDERRRLPEDQKTRKTEGLHRPREMETSRTVDERTKELQRFRDFEKARLSREEQEHIRRLREIEKVHEDRQQLEQLEQVRIAAEETIERLRLKEKAIRAAEEAEKERNRLKKVEIERIAAEERENERQRRDEEKAHAEVAEQLRRREEEKIRISSEEKEFQRIQEEARDRLAAEKRRKAEAARLAEMEPKKHKKPKLMKTFGKMKARVEEDDDDKMLVDVPDLQESADEPALEAARLAEEEARKAAANKKTKKKAKVNNPPTPPAGNSSTNMNMGPTPTPNPASMPPMFYSSPFYPHHTYSPYGTPSPYGSPYPFGPPPPMALYLVCYGQPLSFPPPYATGATINNARGGHINVSNFNNNTTTNTRPRRKKKATH